MQSVVVILLVLGTLSFAIKLSLKQWWQWLAWAALIAIATGLAWPLTSAQSKTQIADFLQNPTLMADASVLLTIEVALMVAYCIAAGSTCRTASTEPPRHAPLRRAARFFLAFFPGLTVFVALFALQTQLIFSLPGVSFSLTSWLMAVAVLLIVPIAAWGIHSLLPEHTLRLELLFVLNLIMLGLGIVATVNGRTAVVGNAQVEWGALLGVVALCIAGLAAGLLIRRIRSRK